MRWLRWTWENADDVERGEWIRCNRLWGLSPENLAERFGLPMSEIERILDGGDYEDPGDGHNPALDKIDNEADPRRVADELRRSNARRE